MSAERDFYARHYSGGVKIGATPLNTFERAMLAPGKRYSLLVDSLSSKPPAGGCIAEIGSGGCEALLILSQRYRFQRVIGVEIAFSGNNLGSIEHFNSNLNEKWPFEDAAVDYLIAMMVIEHLFDPFHAFREIKRCMARSGSAYVNLPLVTSWRNRIRLLFGQLPETSISYERWFERDEWDGNHLHYFSLSSIRHLASRFSLRVTELRGVGPLYRIKTLWPQLLASEVTFKLEHDKER